MNDITRRDLLIELGVEELPPKALRKLSQAFVDGMVERLGAADLAPESRHGFAAPRRLAMRLSGVPERQADRVVEKRGPALTAAFDADGKPTRAAEGFARSCGVSVDQLERRQTDKGEWLYFAQQQPGRSLAELLPEMLESALAALPIPKRMRWGDRSVEFVRPVHWLVLLFGDEVIPARVLDLDSGRATQGHRFHAPQAIELADAGDYEQRLESEGFVLADFDARRARIREQVEAEARRLGGQARIDEDLLDEVTALVEWPVAVSGRFDEVFLEVPPEALVMTMQDNQKYFALFDADGGLMPHFITLANIESREPEQVARGNERVIRPRFADARFFYDQDRKTPLSARLQSLEKVVFQQQLGTLAEKTLRIRRLAGSLAETIGADRLLAERAAELCKCDLMTDMVGEFPKLQGIMGRYYAQHDGEPEEVAQAIEQHYWPRYAGDATPDVAAGQCVALADRVDTLLGIFAIGQKPTGVKDPFGLRRAALGVIRILIERELPVDLGQLLDEAAEALADQIDAGAARDEVLDYVFDRLKGYYAEQGLRGDVVESVLARRPTRLLDLDKRVRAVGEFLGHEAAEALAAANKRIGNILKKVDFEPGRDIDCSLFAEAAEERLFEKLVALEKAATADFEKGDYRAGLEALAELRPVVDAFFDDVMVMSDQEEQKRNRVALLARLRDVFLRVADLSRIQS